MFCYVLYSFFEVEGNNAGLKVEFVHVFGGRCVVFESISFKNVNSVQLGCNPGRRLQMLPESTLYKEKQQLDCDAQEGELWSMNFGIQKSVK